MNRYGTAVLVVAFLATGMGCTGQLHPTPAGSYLAALVIAHGLTGVRPRAVPSRLTLTSGQVFELPEEQVAKLRQAAEKVVGPEG